MTTEQLKRCDEASNHYIDCACQICQRWWALVGKEDAIDIDNGDPCLHDEHDHGYCLDCGEDITDSLVGTAEASFEGDR